MTREDFDKRIKELPFAMAWKNTIGGFMDGIREDGVINYDGLKDSEKLCLYVYAWNKAEFLPGKKGILRTFGWSNYKLQNLIKGLDGKITTGATINPDTGLLSGRGYFYN